MGVELYEQICLYYWTSLMDFANNIDIDTENEQKPWDWTHCNGKSKETMDIELRHEHIDIMVQGTPLLAVSSWNERGRC